MAHFMAITSHRGPFPDDIAQQPAPDPSMFGLPANDDGSRTDVMLAQNLINTTHYEPDFDALRAASTRLVVAAGAESEGEMANRAPMGLPSGSRPSLRSSRATTPASSAASTAGPASRTHSPPSCATSWTPRTEPSPT